MKIYEPEKHKFFDQISTCLISTIGVLISLEAFHNQGRTTAPRDPKYYLTLIGNGKSFYWECFDAMIAVMNDSWPTKLILHEKVERASVNVSAKYTGTGLQKILAKNISFAFINYYESHIETIKHKHGNASDDWPIVWNFARVIRNALTHNNEIEIRNKSTKKVSWREYNYSYEDNGRKVLFTDLCFVEFILLMEDMDQYLHA